MESLKLKKIISLPLFLVILSSLIYSFPPTEKGSDRPELTPPFVVDGDTARRNSPPLKCTPESPYLELFQKLGVAIDRYELNEGSLSDVVDEMRRVGPADDDGIRRNALLSWHLWWRWGDRDSQDKDSRNRDVSASPSIFSGDLTHVNIPTDMAINNLLRLSDIAPTVDADIIERGKKGRFPFTLSSAVRLVIPRWCPKSSSEGDFFTDEDLTRWGRYLERVLEHEAGHLLIFFKHKEIIESNFLVFSQECVNCSIREGNNLGFSGVRALNDEQILYDKITSHGLTQEARLSQSQELYRRS